MQELTERELEALEVLWKIKKGFVKDVLEEYPDPKPPYTTISSIIRILESKGYVTHKAYGKTHEYFPVVSRSQYKKSVLKSMVTRFFDGSLDHVVSFMAKENELSEKEVKEISELIKQLKSNKK